MQNKIVAVIPAYNEENTVIEVIDKVFNYCDYVIVVNDSSTDNTQELLNNYNNKNLIIVENSKTLGIGGSMKKGILKALEFNPKIIIKIDADGQHKPEDIPRFIREIEESNYDLIKGNRFFDVESLVRMPKIKILGNLFITNIQKIVSGNYQISDPNNGFLAIRSSKIQLINLDQLKNNYFFENSLAITFYAHNFKIGEIGIETIYKNEKSSIPILLAGIKIIPVFAIFLFKKNILTARLKLSMNSITFFLGVLLFLINSFLQIQLLWVGLLFLIIFYILTDVINFFKN
jgi:dolichol-phosphate mannosyltransferase